MGRHKKEPKDMTTEELANKIFPKKVKDELKRIAHEKDDKVERKQSS